MLTNIIYFLESKNNFEQKNFATLYPIGYKQNMPLLTIAAYKLLKTETDF